MPLTRPCPRPRKCWQAYGDELADVGRRVTGAEVFVAIASTGEGATEVLGSVTLVTESTFPRNAGPLGMD